MAAYIENLSLDSRDALVLATFWAAAVGSDVDEDSTPVKAFVEAPGWGGPSMWFNQVTEPKVAKNRLHLHLRRLTSMAGEVDRLRELGATVVASYPTSL